MNSINNSISALFDKNHRVVLILLLFSLLLYAPVLNISFLADDTRWFVRADQKLTDFSGYFTVFKFEKGSTVSNYYRPLTTITLHLLDHATSGTPGMIRLFNVFSHTLNGFLIYVLLVQVFRISRPRSLLASLFFICFALHSQAVIWLCNIHDVFGVSWMLLSIFLFFKSDSSKKLLLLSAACYLLSLGYKETFLITPMAVLIIDKTFVKTGKNANYIPYTIIFSLYFYLYFTGYQNEILVVSFSTLAKSLLLTLLKGFWLLFIPVSTRFPVTAFLYSALTLVILIHIAKNPKSISLLVCCGMFLTPYFMILLSSSDDTALSFQGRYFYILSVFLALFFAHMISVSEYAVYAVAALIACNIYMMFYEYDCYKYPNLFHRKISSEFRNNHRKLLIFNVPRWYFYTKKPLAVTFYPGEGVADYKYYNTEIFHATYSIITDNDFSALNNWKYSETDNTLYFPDERIQFWGVFSRELADYSQNAYLSRFDSVNYVFSCKKTPELTQIPSGSKK